jgi:hypothetical protein
MHHFRPKCGTFSRAQYKLIQNLQILQGYIFRILQHFAAKLCNCTNFNMLFLAVVMDFVLLAEIKILSIAGIIHLGSRKHNSELVGLRFDQ